MTRFKGFKKQIKAVEKAIAGKKEKESKVELKLRKQILKEQLKQLKAKKVVRQIEVRKKSILSRSKEEQQPRKQMTFLGRV